MLNNFDIFGGQNSFPPLCDTLKHKIPLLWVVYNILIHITSAKYCKSQLTSSAEIHLDIWWNVQFLYLVKYISGPADQPSEVVNITVVGPDTPAELTFLKVSTKSEKLLPPRSLQLSVLPKSLSNLLLFSFLF